MISSAWRGWTCNQVQVGRAWRVQFNSAIGPFKEQDALPPFSEPVDFEIPLVLSRPLKTRSLPCRWATAKGGSDFDPKAAGK